MEWTDAAIDQLRQLWKEGHSTAEIGRRMGVTKNAVVGKAHRLVLSSRPSPIRREPASHRRPERPARPSSVPSRRPVPPMPSAVQAETPPAPPVEPRAALRSIPLPTSSGGRVAPCCWPIGEPGTRSFRFCDDASLPNKPYCPVHAQLAYVKVRDRRDSAA